MREASCKGDGVVVIGCFAIIGELRRACAIPGVCVVDIECSLSLVNVMRYLHALGRKRILRCQCYANHCDQCLRQMLSKCSVTRAALPAPARVESAAC